MKIENKKLRIYVLTDSDAEEIFFINKSYATVYYLTLYFLKYLFPLEIFDRRESENRQVIYYVLADLKINDYILKKIKFYVIQITYYSIIFRIL